MADDPSEFAIVPVPSEHGSLRNLLTANAVVTGDMAAVMQNIVDSRAQRDLSLLVLRADAAVRAEQEIEEQKAQERATLIQSLCDGISRMCARLDEHEERAALTRELDAQTRQIVDTYSIPDDGIDPDPPMGEEPEEEGDYPAPNLTADPRANDTDPEDKGELPAFLKEPGPYAVPTEAELAHPQKGPSPPASIDL
jgi:hypothetical protein